MKRKYELVIDGKVICADNVKHSEAINEFEYEIEGYFEMTQTQFERLYNDFEPDETGWTAEYEGKIIEIRRA